MRFANPASQRRAGLPAIRVVILAAVAGLATETGCTSEADWQADLANGSNPLAALGATVESTRYTTAYWSQQADSNPTLFARARAYCDAQWAAGSGRKVNCAAVSAAAFEKAGRRVAPKRQRRDPRTSAQ
jgi:hypothetical protein